MYPGPGAYGRAYLTKDERKALSRAERVSLRKDRKAQVKAQPKDARKGFLQALKTSSGLQQQGFVSQEQAADGQTVLFDATASGLIPGVPNWAVAATAVAVAAGAVGTVVFVQRRRRAR